MNIAGRSDLITFANSQLAALAKDGKLTFGTSGTSGPPKRVTLTLAQIQARVAAMKSSGAQYTTANPLFLGLGLNSASGFRDLYMAEQSNTPVQLPGNSLDETAALLAKCAGARLSPSDAAQLAAAFTRLKLAPIPHVTCSGSPMTQAQGDGVIGVLCKQLRYSYGATECGLIAHGLWPDIRANASAVGKPAPGVAVTLVNGILNVAGANVIAGYDGQPPFANGVFVSGDTGVILSDGTIVVTGRK